MSNTDELREQLLARKAEIELALEQLDYIESLASGREIEGDLSRSLQVNGGDKSIAQAVHDELLGKRLTAEQLAKHLGVSVKQVKYALTGHRLRRVVESTKSGGVVRYTIPAEDDGETLPSLSDAVIDLMDRTPERVWKAAEIAEVLQGKVRSNATDFPATVSSTLSAMSRAGRIRKAPGGYAATSSSDES